MADLISRAAALDALDNERKVLIEQERFGAEHVVVHHAWRLIEDLPAVDAAPVVHGRWVKMTGMMPPEYHGHYECSECQWHMKGLRNSWTREEELAYCPNCGAKMDGERMDDDAAD